MLGLIDKIGNMDEETKKEIKYLIVIELIFGGLLAVSITVGNFFWGISFNALTFIFLCLLVAVPIIILAKIYNDKFPLLSPDERKTNRSSNTGYYYNTSVLISDLEKLTNPSNRLDGMTRSVSTDYHSMEDMEIALSNQLGKDNQIQIREEEVEFIGHCIVCSFPIYNFEKLLKCPKCCTLAHRSHFLEWIKIKGYCPKCQASLKYVDFLFNDLEVSVPTQ